MSYPIVVNAEFTELLIKTYYDGYADSNDTELDDLRDLAETAVELLGDRATDELRASIAEAQEAAKDENYNDPEILAWQEARESILRILGVSQDDIEALSEEGERRWDEE